jgi:hypothetical protein
MMLTLAKANQINRFEIARFSFEMAAASVDRLGTMFSDTRRFGVDWFRLSELLVNFRPTRTVRR